MMTHVKRAIRIALGSIFLVLGLAGLVLPVLQGWLFLGLAVVTLSQDIRILANLEAKIISRFPKVGQVSERIRKVIPLWD